MYQCLQFKRVKELIILIFEILGDVINGWFDLVNTNVSQGQIKLFVLYIPSDKYVPSEGDDEANCLQIEVSHKEQLKMTTIGKLSIDTQDLMSGE